MKSLKNLRTLKLAVKVVAFVATAFFIAWLADANDPYFNLIFKAIGCYTLISFFYQALFEKLS